MCLTIRASSIADSFGAIKRSNHTTVDFSVYAVLTLKQRLCRFCVFIVLDEDRNCYLFYYSRYICQGIKDIMKLCVFNTICCRAILRKPLQKKCLNGFPIHCSLERLNGLYCLIWQDSIHATKPIHESRTVKQLFKLEFDKKFSECCTSLAIKFSNRREYYRS